MLTSPSEHAHTAEHISIPVHPCRNTCALSAEKQRNGIRDCKYGFAFFQPMGFYMIFAAVTPRCRCRKCLHAENAAVQCNLKENKQGFLIIASIAEM